MHLYEVPFLIPVIDTQLMAKQLMQRRDIPYKARDLRLFNLRDRYNLPRYAAHHALSDALATAELFLAMATENYQRKNCRLKEFCLR
jgi:DNA polymerase-3 subunit epsilon